MPILDIKGGINQSDGLVNVNPFVHYVSGEAFSAKFIGSMFLHQLLFTQQGIAIVYTICNLTGKAYIINRMLVKVKFKNSCAE